MPDMRLFSAWAKQIVAENAARRERCQGHYPWEEGCWPHSDLGAIAEKLRREPTMADSNYAIRRDGTEFTLVVRDRA